MHAYNCTCTDTSSYNVVYTVLSYLHTYQSTYIKLTNL